MEKGEFDKTRKNIITIFNEIGFKKSWKGYFLLLNLVLEVYTTYTYEELCKLNVGEEYKILIEKYGGTYSSIKRDLSRLLIDRRGVILEYFKYNGTKITTKTFIILMYERLMVMESLNENRF